jgi:KaiC/GvpD/RAD55 family RecA-like ATPase
MDGPQAEAAYEWLDAAKSYEQALRSTSLSDASAAEFWRKIGFCYELASRQAKDIEEFKSVRQLGVRAYEEAASLFCKESTLESRGLSAECLANAEYVRSWLACDPQEKIEALNRCHELGKKAMDAFKAVGNDLYYGQTANMLSKSFYDLLVVTSIGKERNEVSREGISFGDIAISVLSKLCRKDELVQALSVASIQAWTAANISETEDDRKKLADKSVSYAARALELSKEVDNLYSKAMARWAGVLSNLFFTDDIEIASNYAREMLEQSSTVRDNYLRGIASYLLAQVIDWKVLSEENPDKRKRQYQEIIKYAEDGIRYLDLVFQDRFTTECYLFVGQTYSIIASDFATVLAEKLAYSRRAVDVGKKGLEYAIRSGSPEAMSTILHALSKAYYYHSNLEPKKEIKPELLREALNYRKEHIELAKSAFPSNSWILGVSEVYAAQIETNLSRLERDEKDKIAFLKAAIADMEDGVTSCRNWIISRAVPSVVAIVAGYEDALGGILEEGYLLTAENENLSRANKVYVDAAEDFKKVEMPSRVAESSWRIARNLDRLSEYDQAAKNFENAFAAYKAAAQRISQFSDFYLDYASYMKAWSEIEQAKLAHNEEEYDVAMQHYETTSNLLRQSKSWMYLSLNFYAWSLLEQAEDLSRREDCKESVRVFENAVKFLQESKRILKIKLEGIDKSDERDLVKRLIEVSDIREEYSNGRIAIEEARILHEEGDHRASSEKYDKAAAVFQKISLVDSEQAKQFARPLAYLCRAWQKMTIAEARGSPIMYEEAADLFKLASEHAFTESTRLMALGHSSFCKALEAGTEFEITRTMAIYEEANRHMDAAANYYLQAGFETISDYAKATQHLFDAYVFMESATREKDPEKKARHYAMAEKVLQLAADHFVKAKYQKKTEQVQMLLKKVREKRELPLTLNEIFHAPAITSSTGSFSTISATEEVAVGLERFDHAEIQAKLVQHETEVKVGDTVALEIQMVNVGKEPVSLTKIENIVPADFQLVSKPDYCVFEDVQLSMRGKRLDPLKTGEIQITVRPFKKGSVEVTPRIVGVDSVGRQTVYSPEPAAFNVSGAALPGRVSTGYADLDNLLFGGIPENYAVVLTSPSSDERELLIKRFLESGARKGEMTFHVAVEPGIGAALAEEFQSNFFLFVCNPRADVMVKSLSNIFKLKGVESLTDIDIALVKSFRMLDPSRAGPKRACIEIISDVLLQHHAVITRKWLSGLLPDLRAKGFTTLVVVNPHMHPPEEVQAILGLFEGEIRVSERETEDGIGKFLRVRKLYNQRYLENEIVLTRERLES